MIIDQSREEVSITVLSFYFREMKEGSNEPAIIKVKVVDWEGSMDGVVRNRSGEYTWSANLHLYIKGWGGD